MLVRPISNLALNENRLLISVPPYSFFTAPSYARFPYITSAYRDTRSRGSPLWPSLPYSILPPSHGQSLSRNLCSDWKFFWLPLVLVCGSNARVRYLILKYDGRAFGLLVNWKSHIPMISVVKDWSLTLILVTVSNVPQRSSPTMLPTNVEPQTVVTISGSIKHVAQGEPRHDHNTRNTSIRHHPIYLSFS